MLQHGFEPQMGARTLPGKREEANRAGITPKILRRHRGSYHKIRMLDLRKERLGSLYDAADPTVSCFFIERCFASCRAGIACG